jgi:predicted nucleic acid-binding protein
LIVVDASLAVQWIADEADASQALALLERNDLIAPDLLAVEVGSALRRKLEGGEIEPNQLTEGLKLLFGRVELQPHTPELIQTAITISIAMAHPIYDCVYAALAEILGATFVTRDTELTKRMRRSGYGHLLADLTS